MKENALLLGTLFEQPSLFIRLKDELTEASLQFRRDPKAYVIAALRNDTLGGSRRRMLLQFGTRFLIACWIQAPSRSWTPTEG